MLFISGNNNTSKDYADQSVHHKTMHNFNGASGTRNGHPGDMTTLYRTSGHRHAPRTHPRPAWAGAHPVRTLPPSALSLAAKTSLFQSISDLIGASPTVI